MGRLAPVVLTLGLAACGGGGTGSTGPTPLPTPTPQPTATPEPNPGPSPTPPPGPTVLRSATFRGAHGHSASGTARIVQEGADHRLELLPDFRVDTGSIDVYLARSQNSVDMIRDLNLGALKSRSGAQAFPMPDAGGSYPYVLLWCRPFRVPIGVGELR